MEILLFTFFLFIGAEIRAEFSHKRIRAPFLAAVAGMALPALFFRILMPHTSGWAALMPTDIILALGIVALLGKRVSSELRYFILTLGVADDLLSLIVFGIFYRDKIDLPTASSTLIATALGFLMPKRELVIRYLKPWGYFVVTPAVLIYYFPHHFTVNATVGSYLIARIAGKVIGISLVGWLMKVPNPIGIGLLCGMGLTVSTVIANVASSGTTRESLRLGIYLASAIAAVLSLLWFRMSEDPKSQKR
jgi:Na+:H+ antiporter, NhaA family